MASNLPKYYTKTLKNGLKIVVIPLKNESEVITTDIFYKVGSRNEVMGKSGIAHMLEHMNFKSTKNMEAGEFDKIVKRFGGIDNASTGFDYTHYFIKSSNKNLDKSLSLFADMMANLSLKDEEFQPERKVVAEERRWRTDNNPVGYLYFRLFNNAYIYHPYHWTPIGFMNDILNWSIEDIRNFHKTYYQPKNAIIVVAGDIEPETVFEAAKKHFEKIENCCDIPEVHAKEPEPDGPKRVVIYKESEVEIVAITFPIPNFQHEDQPALSALSELLSQGKSSRLVEELVDKKKMVNQLYAYNMELKDPGVFLFLAVCNPGVKAEDVEKEIWNQVEKIKTKGVSEDELKKVKVNTKAAFIFSMENSSNVADLFGGYFARGDIKPLLTYEENIEKLKPEMIKTVAKRYLDKEKSVTVILRKGETK
ncbi:pitrilysin family protein [Hydrogenimonas thermophila]|uniref:M16 family metallopeptidase n=1 Tax=Hydrogenimonas thermophila TaxID=223786 RepID=UPI002936DC4E|nr:pitrilysin family protein [Hydrogenimonas thermophila]WOE68973.1 pitrilysin family protein [Hydrogenimonas thermophila]WOE71480.1 pitrilysin family protein [Hydrogenimonas thermophila]